MPVTCPITLERTADLLPAWSLPQSTDQPPQDRRGSHGRRLPLDLPLTSILAGLQAGVAAGAPADVLSRMGEDLPGKTSVDTRTTHPRGLHFGAISAIMAP